jgi:oligopeptide/dipeptide ABC transporter ATP-binding protein
MIMRMVKPTAGAVLVDGRTVATLLPSEVLAYRRTVQMIFQDPYSSLNPRIRAGDLIAEPLRIHGLAHGTAVAARVAELADQVGLAASSLGRFPHEFSGGQRQRIAIARALAVSPRILVADEPVSALDVSVRAQVLNLLADLQAQRALSYLFISHDIGTVAYLSHRVAVMYLGAIVEIGPAREVLRRPRHPYTRLLLEAVPVAHPRLRARRREVLRGEVPGAAIADHRCRFAPRCPMAADRCRTEAPRPRSLGGDRLVACHFAEATPELPPKLPLGVAA